MSRSYKHSCVYKDKNSRRYKSLANHQVRRTKDISDGGSFKKHFCSYNICDYRVYTQSFDKSANGFRMIWEDRNSYIRKKYPLWKQAYRKWLVWNRMK